MAAANLPEPVEHELVAYRWLGLLNERDAAGRLLSEGSAPPHAHSPGDMEYVACPYADGRSAAGKPMNRSALVSMTRCWDAICGWSRVVADAYRRRASVEGATFLDVWRVAAALRTAPFFILLGRSGDKHPPFEPVPEWVAGAYKAARGVEDAILHMACVGIDVRRLHDFETLYRFVRRHRLFEGSAEVCAGPPALIRVFVEQLAAESPRPSPDRSDWKRHPIAAERAMQRLLDYAACETLVESLSTMYEVGRFRALDIRRALAARKGRDSAQPDEAQDEGRYPLSGLARALSKNYGAENERLLRGYLRLAYPEHASVCMRLLDAPLLATTIDAYTSDDRLIERHAEAYLRTVSDELLRAEQRMRSVLGIEPLADMPSADYLATLFGPSR